MGTAGYYRVLCVLSGTAGTVEYCGVEVEKGEGEGLEGEEIV